MARVSPYFPPVHSVPRVDDRWVVSGIVYLIRSGLKCKDAPKAHGSRRTLYNRFMRRSRVEAFGRTFAALAGEGPKAERDITDAPDLKAHRTSCPSQKAGSAFSLWRQDALTEGSHGPPVEGVSSPG